MARDADEDDADAMCGKAVRKVVRTMIEVNGGDGRSVNLMECPSGSGR